MPFISPSIWTGFIYRVCSQGWDHFAFWKKARPAATSKHSGGDGSQSVSSPHQKYGAASGQELWAWKNTPWKLPWESKCGNLAKSSLEMFHIALAVLHLLLEEKLHIWWERKSEKRTKRKIEEATNVWFSYRVWHFSSNILIWNIQNCFFLGV